MIRLIQIPFKSIVFTRCKIVRITIPHYDNFPPPGASLTSCQVTCSPPSPPHLAWCPPPLPPCPPPISSCPPAIQQLSLQLSVANFDARPRLFPCNRALPTAATAAVTSYLIQRPAPRCLCPAMKMSSQRPPTQHRPLIVRCRRDST